jgi:ribosomal-protein-alanine acetyltransferase
MNTSTLIFSNVEIALMQESDIAAVLDIERRSNPHPWSESNFSEALRQGYLCLVARDESRTVGFVVLRLLVDDAELLLIAVNPDSRRSGCASALLSELSVRMRALNKNALHIEVRQSNNNAIAFYEARGFVRVGMRKKYYPSGLLSNQREDAVLMRAAL